MYYSSGEGDPKVRICHLQKVALFSLTFDES